LLTKLGEEYPASSSGYSCTMSVNGWGSFLSSDLWLNWVLLGPSLFPRWRHIFCAPLLFTTCIICHVSSLVKFYPIQRSRTLVWNVGTVLPDYRDL